MNYDNVEFKVVNLSDEITKRKKEEEHYFYEGERLCSVSKTDVDRMRDSKDFTFAYMMLGRLQSDVESCDRGEIPRWRDDSRLHIAEMKLLYSIFEEDGSNYVRRPDWISWNDIIHYQEYLGLGSVEKDYDMSSFTSKLSVAYL